MCSAEIAGSYRDLKRTLLAWEEYGKRSKQGKSIPKHFSIIKLPLRKGTGLLNLSTNSPYSRRDGSPFVNLLMCAPLCDNRGKVRYFIGAQVDVSGLVKECTGLESLERLVNSEALRSDSRNDAWYDHGDSGLKSKKNKQLQDLCDMLDAQEQESVREWSLRVHKGKDECTTESNLAKPRPLPQEKPPKRDKHSELSGGKPASPYQNYLLVRPFPSLRILFASPSLRVPGILQSSFINKIGGSARVRDELTMAMADGKGVTAKVLWIPKAGDRGRQRWVHCTPLLGSNGQIGVWMIVIIDDGSETDSRRWRQAPPVPPMVPIVAGPERNTDSAFGDKSSPPSNAHDITRSNRDPKGDFQHPAPQFSFNTYGSSLID
jgi:hypothetical protein